MLQEEVNQVGNNDISNPAECKSESNMDSDEQSQDQEEAQDDNARVCDALFKLWVHINNNNFIFESPQPETCGSLVYRPPAS